MEEAEEDDDEEMWSDEAGGEAEVQAEIGATPPPSQPLSRRDRRCVEKVWRCVE